MPPERPASAVRRVGRTAPPPFSFPVQYHGQHSTQEGRGRMRRVWLKRVAFAAVLAFAVFAFGWVPWFLAGLGTTRRFQFPDKENAGLTPASFHLASEDVAFRSADGVE